MSQVSRFRSAPRFHLFAVLAATVAVSACRDEPPTSAMIDPPDSVVASIGALLDAPQAGEPLAGLSVAELARFEAGKEEFVEAEEADEGLGPVFNEASCAVCHDAPVGGTNGRLETRFGRRTFRGFDPLAALGGSLLQDKGIGLLEDGYEYKAEAVPPEANVTALRITTPLFGLGLVDAVPDRTFLQIASLQAAFTPGTAGKVSLVKEIRTGRTRVGRFGWKAQVPTLFQFSGDAYLNEMGITSPEFPEENCPQGDCSLLEHNPLKTLNDEGEGVVAFADFMMLLAPPPRGPVSRQVFDGSEVFTRIGCGSCHTRVLVTGDHEIRALSNKAFQPFSDFLLHDMGSLGDGIVQGAANGREMRTAPLWGLRTRSLLLHDGRASSIEAAIRAHDGQGRRARDRFAGLSAGSREALLAFLNSL